MSKSHFGSGGSSSNGSVRRLSRAGVVAFVVAATAVCLAGGLTIVALSNGASAVQSLLLMAGVVLLGAVIATGVVLLGHRRRRAGHRANARQERRQMRRDRRALHRTKVCSPELMLAEQLSARYGVPVERVAAHVWRIDGQLVEATLDPATGQLMTGGRELQL